MDEEEYEEFYRQEPHWALALLIAVTLCALFVIGGASTCEGSWDAHNSGWGRGTSYAARFMQWTPTYRLAYWLALPHPDPTPAVTNDSGNVCVGSAECNPCPKKGQVWGVETWHEPAGPTDVWGCFPATKKGHKQ